MTWDWRLAAASEGRVKQSIADQDEGWLHWRLARGMCDSSSHLNLLPRAADRPCAYHLRRAVDTIKAMRRHEP